MKTSHKILRNTFILLLVSAFSLILAARINLTNPDDLPAPILASGTMKQEMREINPFSKIQLVGNYQVFFTPGPTALSIQADAHLLPLIETEVTNGQLNIRQINDAELDFHPDVRIELSTDLPLEGINLTGSGRFTSDTVLMLPSLAINQSGDSYIDLNIQTNELSIQKKGVGWVKLRGQAKSLDINSKGDGQIQAFDLKSEQVKANLNGNGLTEVNSDTQIRVGIKGMGKLHYKGQATVIKNISGKGEVHKVD